MILGVIGNIMVPIVIMKTKDMRNSTNIFLFNLSIADLLVLLVCTPTVLVEVNSRPETWVLGQEMCKAVPFVELTVAHASALTILAISFERYYAICEPLRAAYVCTKTRALLICVIAWVVAALFTSPILLVAEYKFEEYFDGTYVPVCLTQATTPWKLGFFLMTISFFFVVPLFVLIILYSIIACNLTSKDGAMMRLRPTKHEFSFKARKQVVLMLGAVVLSFFLCLLPFRMLTLWIILGSDITVKNISIEKYYNLLFFSRIMLYLNSAINPILYNVMSSKFRKGFVRLCCCCCCNPFQHTIRSRTVTLNTTITTSSSFLSRSSNRRNSEKTTFSLEKLQLKILDNRTQHRLQQQQQIQQQQDNSNQSSECELNSLKEFPKHLIFNCPDLICRKAITNYSNKHIVLITQQNSIESSSSLAEEIDAEINMKSSSSSSHSIQNNHNRIKCKCQISFDENLIEGPTPIPTTMSSAK